MWIRLAIIESPKSGASVRSGSKTAIPTALEKRFPTPLLPSFAEGVEAHIALAVRAVHA